MLHLEPEQTILSVVLTGEFNPSIFHPAWFSQNELLPQQETDSVEEMICTNEVSTFVLDDVHFQVERQRFGLTTKDASKGPFIRDLALGTFGLLEHTPLAALGLNLDLRYALESEDSWHKVGHALAPKSYWEGILSDPGMMGVSVRGKRPDCDADRVDIRVRPVAGIKNGVFVGINQHYQIETSLRTSITERNQTAMHILQNDWGSFRSYAEKAAEQLVQNALSDGGQK